MLKLKLQYFGHLMRKANSLEKTLTLEKIERTRRRGLTEDEMVGWQHRLNGHECEQESEVAQSCLTLWDSIDCGTPGFPVLHHLLEFAQTQVHWVSDAIQPSHPLLSPSPPAFYLSQHQGLSQWVDFSHQVAKVLSFSFSISPSNEYSGLISFRIDRFDLLCSPRNSQESSPTPQFESINSSVLSLLYGPALTSVHDY